MNATIIMITVMKMLPATTPTAVTTVYVMKDSLEMVLTVKVSTQLQSLSNVEPLVQRDMLVEMYNVFEKNNCPN